MPANKPQPLHIRLGRLRIENELDSPEVAATPAREKVDVVDGAIRVAAALATAGTKGAERRAAIRGVQPGSTVSSSGTGKTRVPREQKQAKTRAWAEGLTEQQRFDFLLSEKFAALSESARQHIEEAFDAVGDAADVGSSDAAQEVDWNIAELDQQEEDQATDAWLEGLDDSSDHDAYDEDDE